MNPRRHGWLLPSHNSGRSTSEIPAGGDANRSERGAVIVGGVRSLESAAICLRTSGCGAGVAAAFWETSEFFIDMCELTVSCHPSGRM